MKYTDCVKAMLLASINEIAADPTKFARNPGKDFTRNRKLSFRQLLLLFLTMEGDCIREELYRYFGRSADAPSKAAFYPIDVEAVIARNIEPICKSTIIPAETDVVPCVRLCPKKSGW